ncbi:YqzE family protein [Shimazuella sp. AN120528]|uniref:YqzE family protein n=1 Tax=Shimazuella soli TaxID=1892854 RepID=UPI001F0F6412|nr:YqzE family protein [Shimazuella soli]MCH5583921.1 YqzE family protein [Shimazuella soli]
MSFKDWITYVIEKMVWFMETPKKDRKAMKYASREPWAYRWFGMIPMSMKIAAKKVRKR